MGALILRWASRLDAFSGYPIQTWLISSALARRLIHQRSVRLGPLVLETTPLKAPAPMVDRDRQFCYSRAKSSRARSFLPDSACRHAARTVSSGLAEEPCLACSL